MNTSAPVTKSVDKPAELAFYKDILDSLPAVVYINELQIPGDPLSCRNVWTNKTGLDLLGYTQEEITQLGYQYFREIMHPDDLEILPIPINGMYADTSIPVLVCMQRVRYKNQQAYHWSYGHGMVLECFDNGSPRKLLVVAMEITDSMHSNNQLTAALKEIKQLKDSLKLCSFTKREKEILALIVSGKTDKRISEDLFISIRTAKKHRSNILHKADVKNTAELVAMVKESGWY